MSSRLSSSLALPEAPPSPRLPQAASTISAVQANPQAPLPFSLTAIPLFVVVFATAATITASYRQPPSVADLVSGAIQQRH